MYETLLLILFLTLLIGGFAGGLWCFVSVDIWIDRLPEPRRMRLREWLEHIWSRYSGVLMFAWAVNFYFIVVTMYVVTSGWPPIWTWPSIAIVFLTWPLWVKM